MITRNSKLEDILKLPEMEGRRYMVDPGVEPLLLEILGEENFHVLMAGRKVAEIPFQVFPVFMRFIPELPMAGVWASALRRKAGWRGRLISGRNNGSELLYQ